MNPSPPDPMVLMTMPLTVAESLTFDILAAMFRGGVSEDNISTMDTKIRILSSSLQRTVRDLDESQGNHREFQASMDLVQEQFEADMKTIDNGIYDQDEEDPF